MDRQAFTVTYINQYIKTIFERDFVLTNISIKGEISNLKFHSSGHIYFTLKDEESAINCVMFKSRVQNISFEPENGMMVTILGYISVYEKTGTYQLYTEFIELSGKGALYVSFERLKTKLLTEGLFNAEYKKEIPSYPSRVAVVTSPSGAVIKDILHISKRRNQLVSFIIVPVPVQGRSAAFEIASAIKQINIFRDIDVIIIARGGGSIEDLWAFNEEIVARAVYASKIPVISAVGHETDFTIADFVSDLRAPTPSAAAELVTPLLSEMLNKLESISYTLYRYLFEKTLSEEMRLDFLVKRLKISNPIKLLVFRYEEMETYKKRLIESILRKLYIKEQQLQGFVQRLHGLSPLLVIARGYSITKNENGKIIYSVANVKEGQKVVTQLKDGVFISTVDKTILD